MEAISSVNTLLNLANVSKLTTEALPKVLETLVNNKIRLREQALREVLLLIQSTPVAMTSAYDSILFLTNNAIQKNDERSLAYINQLLNIFMSSGISDTDLSALVKQVEQHAHEIRLEDRKGMWTIATLMVGGLILLISDVISQERD